MTAERPDPRSVRVYLCGCGPLLADALDLDELAARAAEHDGVLNVARHPTLCSPDGQKWMEQDLASAGDCAVVMAGCSPREHQQTFMSVCARAGVNPYLLTIANIREQCAWVTPIKAQATRKAVKMIRAAVERARQLAPLEHKETPCRDEVLVVGGGVAGLTAADLLASAGRHVILVERSPVLGGRSALLANVFPSGECASCMMSPLIDEALHHDHVETLMSSEVVEVLGYAGNFTVRIRRRARHVDVSGCMGCRSCHEACPVSVPNENDDGLSQRKAAYLPYEGALPHASVIDEEACVRFHGQPCDACERACPMGNIDLSEREEVVERKVAAILLATGASSLPFSSAAPMDGVVPWTAVERMLSSAGPTAGRILTPTGAVPRRIALLACGDEGGSGATGACSSLRALTLDKLAGQLRDAAPACEVVQFSFEGSSCAVSPTNGIGRINLSHSDRVSIVDRGAGLRIRVGRDAGVEELEFDMVVVAPPLRGSAGVGDLCKMLRIGVDPEDFVIADHEHLRPFRTRVEGVMVAGSAGGPSDIRTAAAQGAAAAGAVLSGFIPGRMLALEPACAEVRSELCGGCHTCVVTCPFGAVQFDGSERVAKVDGLLCRGCGACVSGCPTHAMVNHHFDEGQMAAELSAYSAPRGGQDRQDAEAEE
jgi:heterodisulfide reductase subunit A2